MHSALSSTIKRALAGVDALPAGRRRPLDDVAAFVSSKRAKGQTAALTFICTHNSRRSQMAQLWAAAAAAYFDIDDVGAYSGGTEVTAFNPRAVAAMTRAGFVIDNPGGDNPHYRVTYAEEGPSIECFSKTYDDPSNPSTGFAAVMTCSEADEACPVVLGAELRARVRYDDPKSADGTSEEASTYDARCLQIATEMLYLFSRVV